MRRYGELAGWVVADHLTASPNGRASDRPRTLVEAFRSAARAHDRTAEAHERSIRTGVGDLAEHRRLAEFHRAAAEDDRQRAGKVESQAVDREPAGSCSAVAAA
jgi:hypothetical protein